MKRFQKRSRDIGELNKKREQLAAYLARHKLRHTEQRELILEEFLRCDKHVTTEELWERLRKQDGSIGYATVYRTLKLFTECGLASKHDFGEGSARYESESGQHHDHMICTRCGQITEFENEAIERLQEQICRHHQFQLQSHRMELYGLCSPCQRL